jgi:hypothetical protein
MVVDLFDLLAKGAKPTIFPSTLLQSMRCPKSILKNKPCMVLYFWRRLSFLNKLIHARFNMVKELQLVNGSRKILPITG